MYKYQTGPEPDHDGYEWVEPEAQCENCGNTNRECTCGDVIEDREMEHRNQPVAKSFYQKYGYYVRDGPPEEEEEERGYVDDPDEPFDMSIYRRW